MQTEIPDSLMIYATLGLDDHFIDYVSLERPVHREAAADLIALKKRAAGAGFNLRLASGFRNFDQQLKIWNDKALGKRPVLNSDEKPVDVSQLSPRDLMFTILRWSALPGASRHHWGSDVDVFDASAIDDHYQLKLTIEETREHGPFTAFYQWLELELNKTSCPFFRPYNQDQGGIAPEPWHLSHKTLAHRFYQCLTPDALRTQINCTDIQLKDEIIENMTEIFNTFIAK